LEGRLVGKILQVTDDEITIGIRCIHGSEFLLEDIHGECVGDGSMPVDGSGKSFHIILNF
jgi:hypothetical protein